MKNQKSESNVNVVEQNVEVAVYGANLPAQRGFSMPSNYKLPSKAEQFFKLKAGKNSVRVVSSELVECFLIFGSDKKTNRKRIVRDVSGEIEKDCYFSQKEIDALNLTPDKETGKIDQPKYCWILKVWNYDLKRIQVWEISQATIQKDLTNCFSDADYADCTMYDLHITKEGEKLNTKYTFLPGKEKDLPAEFWENVRLTTCNIDAIFEGAYPMEY